MTRKPYEPPAIEQTVGFGSAELARLDSCGTAVVFVPAQRPYPHTSTRIAILSALAEAAASSPAPPLPGPGCPLTLRFVAGRTEAPRRLQRVVRRVDFFRRKTWEI
jgi:hypothetical protein